MVVVLDGKVVLVVVRTTLLQQHLETVVHFHESRQFIQIPLLNGSLESDQRRSFDTHQNKPIVLDQSLQLITDWQRVHDVVVVVVCSALVQDARYKLQQLLTILASIEMLELVDTVRLV